MMGTLAGVLAGKRIPTTKDNYWAEVEGDIENVGQLLKVTEIRVTYHLKVPKDKAEDARDALSSYLKKCPAAQSVIGCIGIKHNLILEDPEA